MARGEQQIIAVQMNKQMTEYSKPTENSMTEGECIGCLNDSSAGGQTVESKEGENADETTSKAKKKNKSEKQKERVRQYKKKIRKARRQMAAEKRMEEANNNTGQPAADTRPPEANVAEKAPTETNVLPPRQIPLPPEPVAAQFEPADNAMVQALKFPTKAPSNQDIHSIVILDNSAITSDDMFGILSVYVESSLHFESDKNSSDKTRYDDDFGYVYFSMSNFLK